VPEDSKLNLFASSPVMKQLVYRVQRFAPRKRPILLLGESGTGKTWLAARIHEMSPFRDGEFVCRPAPHLEPTGLTELAGHSDTAYTGARRSEPGALEQAFNGTLFIDEIGSASAEVQKLLVTFTEATVVRRMGGQRTVPVRFRLITATNEPIGPLMKKHAFRKDLYWRISTYILHLPPLRERKGDIAAWARALLAEEARKEELPVPKLSPSALQRLRDHPWLGNLRELTTVLARTLALVPDQPVLHAEDLVFEEFDSAGNPKREKLTPARIRLALEQHPESRQQAAEALGITDRHLRRVRPKPPSGPA
jgi:transcriptional regulator with PAS, ATPase and Fis domain